MTMRPLLLLVLLALPALASDGPLLDAGAAPAVGAADLEPEVPRSEPPEGAGGELELGWTLARTVVVLGLVIALAYLTLNVGLRRLLGVAQTGGASVVKVLERVPLDQRRTLYVVEAAGEVLLVGASDGSLGLITRLDAAAVGALRARPGPSAPGPVQPSPLLARLLGTRRAPSRPAPGEDPK
jgi:flagellar biogenesis protein FliO